MLKKLATALADFFYPPVCAVCGETAEASGRLCGRCRARAAHPRAYAAREAGLAHIDGVLALARYRGGLQTLLHKVKFSGQKELLPLLAGEFEFLWEGPGRAGLERLLGNYSGGIAAIPVPTDGQRLIARGYDLPKVIFQAWSRRQNYAWRECLKRCAAKRPQYELTGLERRNNMAGAVAAEYVPEEGALLIVDDILTTGATLCECARALRSAGGAKKIIVGLAVASDAQNPAPN
ncbi:MAG: double zinc ribbon domain-containing protein [Acidaminococcales bacterium]|jgi:ComF family protein|nr:double zinc ribbon domain-containing protein [Acidaminococcales bacterium]